jgi:anti-anti-sigma regulatory factor
MVYEVANGVLIYYLPEELDHYAADMLKRKTAHVFDEEEIRYLIFDFSKTQFRHRADYRTVSDGA